MASICDLVALQNGQAAPRFVLELVWACDRSGIRLAVVDGDVIPTCDCPGMIDDDLLEDLRDMKPGVLVVLQNMPGDLPGRRF